MFENENEKELENKIQNSVNLDEVSEENDENKNFEEDRKIHLEEENLKDKFDPTKYVSSEFNEKSSKKKNFTPVLIFLLIVVIGIITYKILGNQYNDDVIAPSTETETTTVEENNKIVTADDYKNKFWNEDKRVDFNTAFSNYVNAKNVEWSTYEKDGKTVFLIKTEIDISKVLDYYSNSNKIGGKNGDISERVYLYFRKFQNDVKIYDNSYFYVPKNSVEINGLDLAKRELEIINGKKTYVNPYLKDLKDVYGKNFNYEVFLNNLNGYISGKTSTNGNLSNISVKFVTKEKADEELNKIYQELTAVLTEDQKPSLIDSEKSWIEYKDSEFKFLDSLFTISNENNSSETAKKLSERYKINIIEDRINTLNKYKELVSKNGFIKIDTNEVTKQQEALKERYAALLSHLKENDLVMMKESESRWNSFVQKDTLFINKLQEIYNISENAPYTLTYEPYSNRYKMLSVYDQLTFE
mgnify:FL=1